MLTSCLRSFQLKSKQAKEYGAASRVSTNTLQNRTDFLVMEIYIFRRL